MVVGSYTFHFKCPPPPLPSFCFYSITASTASPSRELYINVCVNIRLERQMVCIYLHASGHPSKRRAAPSSPIFLLELWCLEQVYQAIFTGLRTLSAGVNHSGHFPFYWAFFVYYFIILDLFHCVIMSSCYSFCLFLRSFFFFLQIRTNLNLDSGDSFNTQNMIAS